MKSGLIYLLVIETKFWKIFLWTVIFIKLLKRFKNRTLRGTSNISISKPHLHYGSVDIIIFRLRKKTITIIIIITTLRRDTCPRALSADFACSDFDPEPRVGCSMHMIRVDIRYRCCMVRKYNCRNAVAFQNEILFYILQ